MRSLLWVIAFDVSSARTRYRVVKRLRSDTVRVARSVFEGHLSPGRLAALRNDLVAQIDPLTDRLVFYPACAWCETRVLALGTGGGAERADYYLF